MQGERTEAWLVIYLVCAVALVLAGCAGWRHGSTLEQYEGQVLPVAGGGVGAQRLEIESVYDSTVRDFVGQHGPPDYLYVAGRSDLRFIYVEGPLVAFFRRPWWTSKSQVTVNAGREAVRDAVQDGRGAAAVLSRTSTEHGYAAPTDSK
jgi:hypothetical protein